MNYLAHIFLAGSEPSAQLGGLLGDFCKPHNDGMYAPDVIREIRLHRMIDSFTDSHQVVLAAKATFDGPSRRFSGLVLDVLYDHFLASNWLVYSPIGLADFTNSFYDFISSTELDLPDRLKQIVPHMVRDDWLGSYVRYAGFEYAIKRLAKRLSRGGEEMVAGLEDVAVNLNALEAGFKQFFPELQAFVRQQRAQLMV